MCLCLVYHTGNTAEKQSYAFEDLSSSLFSIVVAAQVPIETESKEQMRKIQMNRSKLAVLHFIRHINMTNRHWVWVSF